MPSPNDLPEPKTSNSGECEFSICLHSCKAAEAKCDSVRTMRSTFRSTFLHRCALNPTVPLFLQEDSFISTTRSIVHPFLNRPIDKNTLPFLPGCRFHEKGRRLSCEDAGEHTKLRSRSIEFFLDSTGLRTRACWLDPCASF